MDWWTELSLQSLKVPVKVEGNQSDFAITWAADSCADLSTLSFLIIVTCKETFKRGPFKIKE